MTMGTFDMATMAAPNEPSTPIQVMPSVVMAMFGIGFDSRPTENTNVTAQAVKARNITSGSDAGAVVVHGRRRGDAGHDAGHEGRHVALLAHPVEVLDGGEAEHEHHDDGDGPRLVLQRGDEHDGDAEADGDGGGHVAAAGAAAWACCSTTGGRWAPAGCRAGTAAGGVALPRATVRALRARRARRRWDRCRW